MMIVSFFSRCTEAFNIKSAEISIFGVPLWYKSNTPRTVISPAVQPGECWSFQGFPGYLVLKLNNNVYVSGFTMEHIPKSLAPNGRIDSAPKVFTVWVSHMRMSMRFEFQNSLESDYQSQLQDYIFLYGIQLCLRERERISCCHLFKCDPYFISPTRAWKR